MTASLSKLIIIGLVAGLLGTLASLFIAYIVGVLLILISLKEFFATVLASLTVLPIMILLVLLPLGLFIAVITGLALAVTSHLRQRVSGALMGGLTSIALAVLILSVIAPLSFIAHPGDFIEIITKPLVSGCFGLILGSITGLQFRRMAS